MNNADKTPKCPKCTTVKTCSHFFPFLQDDSKIQTEVRNYVVSATAIRDKSMLSSEAQKLCENIGAHWMTPVCSAPGMSMSYL